MRRDFFSTSVARPLQSTHVREFEAVRPEQGMKAPTNNTSTDIMMHQWVILDVSVGDSRGMLSVS